MEERIKNQSKEPVILNEVKNLIIVTVRFFTSFRMTRASSDAFSIGSNLN